MQDARSQADYLIIGGGTAGCVLAARLSEDPETRVVLVEAGPNISEASMPRTIRQAYPSRAFFTREFFHPGIFGRFGNAGTPAERPRSRYEQARVLGGGSTINGLVGNRGAPADYDEWQAQGAAGWNWDSVLPYFRKLENDLDRDGPYHGQDGPMPIRRLRREETTGFTRQSFDVLKARGFAELEDQNGAWRDGVMAPTITLNAAGERASAAVCYLPEGVRARANLTLLTETEATRLSLDAGRITGAHLRANDGTETHIPARETVLCCGAINTPALLMRNGIGPADHLAELGIAVVRDLPGVGRNLHEHPALGISCFVRPGNRHEREDRHHTQLHLRFSSGVEGCPPSDMKMALLARSAWHRVGSQLGTFYLWVNKPFSEGVVRLTSADPGDAPEVDFRMLSDPRDLQRLREGFRYIVDVARDRGYDAVRHEVFPTVYSDRVRKVSRPTRWNAFQTAVLARILDSFGFARARLIRSLIAPMELEPLMRDDAALDAYMNRSVVGVWHPTGTCRMGAADDPDAVTNPEGRVHGVEGLRVCDASLMPTMVSANTNLPTMMVAERIADLIRGKSEIPPAGTG